MNKAYILVFDRKPDYNYIRLHNGIKNDPDIKNWWHYITSTYLIISSLSAGQLTDSIKSYFPDHRFLIVQIQPGNYSGWLAREAWDWIRTNIG